MGLIGAFLLRGASLVLAMQWSVVDACAAEMVLTFVQETRKGTSPTDALRQAQARARAVGAEQILAWCDEVLKEFPAVNHPHEAAQVNAQAAWVAAHAVMTKLARHHGAGAERLLRRLHRTREADRLAALTRADALQQISQPRLRSFDHPIFWSAFQLVGRVA